MLAVLDKTNIVGIFSEATTADIKTVLANNTETSCAHTTTTRTFAIAFGVGAPDVFVTHCWKETLGRKNKVFGITNCKEMVMMNQKERGLLVHSEVKVMELTGHRIQT